MWMEGKSGSNQNGLQMETYSIEETPADLLLHSWNTGFNYEKRAKVMFYALFFLCSRFGTPEIPKINSILE